MDKNDYLKVGEIVGSRGLCGELKVNHWCDSSDVFCGIQEYFLAPGTQRLSVISLRVHKSQILMKVESVKSKEAAEKLRGAIIYASKEDIPRDKNYYFIEDLKGCLVLDASTQQKYGELNDVFNRGSTDIYSVLDKEGREFLVPIIEGTVDKIDLNNRQIFISPIKGVFDDN